MWNGTVEQRTMGIGAKLVDADAKKWLNKKIESLMINGVWRGIGWLIKIN